MAFCHGLCPFSALGMPMHRICIVLHLKPTARLSICAYRGEKRFCNPSVSKELQAHVMASTFSGDLARQMLVSVVIRGRKLLYDFTLCDIERHFPNGRSRCRDGISLLPFLILPTKFAS